MRVSDALRDFALAVFLAGKALISAPSSKDNKEPIIYIM